MSYYHSKYWAHALTCRGVPGSIAQLSRSIANASVDLNPHQVEAALIALSSPLSKGMILADEVGLGKTIEAGLVIAQRWAERRRRILLIVPAMLRKQWEAELIAKFHLPAIILETRSFQELLEQGHKNPFDQIEKIVITSYQFAASQNQMISLVPWDLAIIDEAHRLRNVHKTGNKQANIIKNALTASPKLLLTATPLQNSLLELYGMVSLIDPHVFGDVNSFKSQFLRDNDDAVRNQILRERLKPVIFRTLRKQVAEFIPFTKRISITQDFAPSQEEQRLYDGISAYLQRDSLYALPESQRALITLVLRKLLASSSFAISKTLCRIVERLERMEQKMALVSEEDYDSIEELEEEWVQAAEIQDEQPGDEQPSVDQALLLQELKELRGYSILASGISKNAKGEALVKALKIAFERTDQLGAQRKAVIFTESRHTQTYLFELLSEQGFRDQIVLINGSNKDPLSTQIYEAWRQRHQGEAVVTGARPVDIKAALVEHFRDHAIILIATEAAAEGVNLQFCSLVVNYDLPWNPQRIEQRIGRCHRYGQKHDVVVVNFINTRNDADQRVHQLLSEKLKLFEGVFGISDEVLGALASGLDLEKRIAEIYQTCRTSEEIAAAFDRVQQELEQQIQDRLQQTRQALIENFDEDVSAKLRCRQDETKMTLSQREEWLIGLTRIELADNVHFNKTSEAFEYTDASGKRHLFNIHWKDAEQENSIFYRQDHALARQLIQNALERPLPVAEIEFSYNSYGQIISVLKPLVGSAGWLELHKLTVVSSHTEEYLVFCSLCDDGTMLDQDACEKLFRLPGTIHGPGKFPGIDLTTQVGGNIQKILKEVDQRGQTFINREMEKLECWSDDLKAGKENELKQLDKDIRDMRKSASIAGTLKEKLDAQLQIKELEATRNKKRREIYEAHDEIERNRDALITDMQKQLQHRHESSLLFRLRWTLT